MLEFADIDIEPDAAQVTAFERVYECLLVDNLAARDIDEHAAVLHRGKTVLIEQTGRLGRPLAADDDEIALRQKSIEVVSAAELTEPRRQFTRLGVKAGAENAHAEGGAEPAHIAPNAAGADDADGLAFHQQRPVGAVVEATRPAIDGRVMQTLREEQDCGYRVF